MTTRSLVSALSSDFAPFGIAIRSVSAPAHPPQPVEETWTLRVRPTGPSGRAMVEARGHRRAAWSSDPTSWPEAVRALAQARRMSDGRALSARPYRAWRALEGAKARARRIVEVALVAVRATVAPLVAWIEAVAWTPDGMVSARVRADAGRADIAAFRAWVAAKAVRAGHVDVA